MATTRSAKNKASAPTTPAKNSAATAAAAAKRSTKPAQVGKKGTTETKPSELPRRPVRCGLSLTNWLVDREEEDRVTAAGLYVELVRFALGLTAEALGPLAEEAKMGEVRAATEEAVGLLGGLARTGGVV
ncbi:hypothetical protein LTR08_000731 [Meristemomyces frigidus]|nr:hypothetical protein LTR08_000731 [Meristemomyces frigidus]